MRAISDEEPERVCCRRFPEEVPGFAAQEVVGGSRSYLVVEVRKGKKCGREEDRGGG